MSGIPESVLDQACSKLLTSCTWTLEVIEAMDLCDRFGVTEAEAADAINSAFARVFLARTEPTMPDDGIQRSAIFSPCRTWRYALERVWDEDKPRVLFVLLNPSTADEKEDDPTNRRGIGFAKSWGFGSIVFVNLFAYRTPHPQELKKARDPVGPQNDGIIFDQACCAEKVVLAWGTHGAFRGRDQEVIELLGESFNTYCLGTTKHGYPRHPLYLKATTPLEVW